MSAAIGPGSLLLCIGDRPSPKYPILNLEPGNVYECLDIIPGDHIANNKCWYCGEHGEDGIVIKDHEHVNYEGACIVYCSKQFIPLGGEPTSVKQKEEEYA